MTLFITGNSYLWLKNMVWHPESVEEFPSWPLTATDGRMRALPSMENEIVWSQYLWEESDLLLRKNVAWNTRQLLATFQCVGFLKPTWEKVLQIILTTRVWALERRSCISGRVPHGMYSENQWGFKQTVVNRSLLSENKSSSSRHLVFQDISLKSGYQWFVCDCYNKKKCRLHTFPPRTHKKSKQNTIFVRKRDKQKLNRKKLSLGCSTLIIPRQTMMTKHSSTFHVHDMFSSENFLHKVLRFENCV